MDRQNYPAIFKNEETFKNKREKFQQASHFRQMAMNCCFLHYSRMFKQCQGRKAEMYLSFSIAEAVSYREVFILTEQAFLFTLRLKLNFFF
jgi:hypothetical protein